MYKKRVPRIAPPPQSDRVYRPIFVRRQWRRFMLYLRTKRGARSAARSRLPRAQRWRLINAQALSSGVSRARQGHQQRTLPSGLHLPSGLQAEPRGPPAGLPRVAPSRWLRPRIEGVSHAPDLVAGAHADPLRDRAVLVLLLCELLLGEERLVGRPATERASAFTREQTAHGTCACPQAEKRGDAQPPPAGAVQRGSASTLCTRGPWTPITIVISRIDV